MGLLTSLKLEGTEFPGGPNMMLERKQNKGLKWAAIKMDLPSTEKTEVERHRANVRSSFCDLRLEVLIRLPLELQLDSRIWEATVQGRGQS